MNTQLLAHVIAMNMQDFPVRFRVRPYASEMVVFLCQASGWRLSHKPKLEGKRKGPGGV
jgi:hypothetical protein